MQLLKTIFLSAVLAGGGLSVTTLTAHAASWEPTKTVEFIVPAGTGGGADHMARLIQGIVTKNKLIKPSLVVVNKAGGAGAEGFLDIKNSKGDPHKIVITLSNLFTTPLATGVPFSWKDMTPVAMLALDEFILWVNADTPYKTAQDYIGAAKAAGGKLKMGGTGSKQEDQIITALVEKASGAKFIYVPYRGGGEVAVQLVGKHVESTVNNPIEAVAQWRGGKLRPLCVFDTKPLPYKDKVADKAWGEIPTCKESGLDVDYLMLRGIFMPPDVKPEHVAFYVDLMQKVRATAEWRKFMEEGAFNQTFMSGVEFTRWIANEEIRHRLLMQEAGFVAK